jgi:hypothetical protein
MDGRQPDVSGSNAIFTTPSKMLHEFPDKSIGNILHYKV